MNHTTIQNLLDSVYELEGLLQLAAAGRIPVDALPRVVIEKIELLRRLASTPDPLPHSPSPEAGEYSLEDAEDAVEAPLPDANVGTVDTDAPAGTPTAALPSFSINDRYLYIREIFNGNPVAFDEAMDRIACCCNREEAEEYLYAELELNPENSVHADFIRSAMKSV